MKNILSKVVPKRWRQGAKLVKLAGQAERYMGGLVWPDRGAGLISADGAAEASNPLAAYFAQHKTGHGLWKWTHYFDIYHRHLQKFVGKPVNLVEIGIYSGGSLNMWRQYFGESCRIYGIDIEPACKAYEAEGVRVFIGDQADREFWKRFRNEVPEVDVVIDDGGHLMHQQRISLEEMLPHLRDGGVYICEDVVGDVNQFACFVQRMALALNAGSLQSAAGNPERCLYTSTSALQAHVHSIHSYPFVSVVERTNAAVKELVSPKHGTEWQPFLSPTGPVQI